MHGISPLIGFFIGLFGAAIVFRVTTGKWI